MKKILKRLALPSFYLYGLLVPSFLCAFEVGIGQWFAVCYLVLGAVILLVPDIYKKVIE